MTDQELAFFMDTFSCLGDMLDVRAVSGAYRHLPMRCAFVAFSVDLVRFKEAMGDVGSLLPEKRAGRKRKECVPYLSAWRKEYSC